MILSDSDCVIDFESQSAVDLVQAGGYRYAEDPSTRVLCCSYWFPDSIEVGLHVGHGAPPEVIEHVRAGGRVWAWNSMFEWGLWNRTLKLPGDLLQFRCIMSLALMHGLPGSLDKATRLARMPHTKSKEGRSLINKLCKPQKKLGGRLPTPADYPEDFEAFYRYCVDDTRAEVGMLKMLPNLSVSEQEVFNVDRVINERGMEIDREAAAAALLAVIHGLAPLNEEAARLSGGAITNVATQHERTLKWLQARGFSYDTLRKEVLNRILVKHRFQLAPELVQMLDLRLLAAKSSTSKLEAVSAGVCADGRIRGVIKHSGAARTQRWSGQRPLQTHNFPRPQRGFKPQDQEIVLSALKSMPTAQAYSAIDFLYGKPIHAISSSLRGIIRAKSGCVFKAADFAAIEARDAAWQCGEQWLLDAFARDEDAYKIMASSIYHTPVTEITDAQRFIGKTAVLGCGYGMGPEKFVASVIMLDPNSDITLEEGERAVGAYREKNANIVQGWYSLQRAAVRAVLHPGKLFSTCRVTFVYLAKSGVLKCVLPSGRALYYWGAEVENDGRGGVVTYQRYPEESADKSEDEIALEDEEEIRSGRRAMWGGAFLENTDQAICRDLLAHGLVRLARLGAPIVLHVHDEVVLEVHKDADDWPLQRLISVLTEVPAWAAGFPIKAEGWEDRRFRK